MIEPTFDADATPLKPRLVPKLKLMTVDGGRHSNCLDLEAKPISYRLVKRTFDIVGATVLLIVLFPLFALLALLVKLTSKGPIFYKSTRVGLCGRPFTFIKFRSMRVDADEMLERLRELNEKDGPIFKIKTDPRITPIGRVLRKYSLDEMPQLLSVLKGEMSLVGPRPPIPHEVDQYDSYALQRLTVLPGITCFWQIMGRSNLSFEEWMALDHRYLQEMSFMTDLQILLRTPIAVFHGDGAF